MKTKLAALMFAIGFGMAAGSAIAYPMPGEETCGWWCRVAYMDCVASGADENECNMERMDCDARCGI